MLEYITLQTNGKTIDHSANVFGENISLTPKYGPNELKKLNMKEKKEDINAKIKHKGITKLSLMRKDFLRK